MTKSENHYDINVIIRCLLLVNVVVYLMWRFAHYLENKGHDGRFIRWMQRHFTSSWDGSIRHRRYWTLLTSSISHEHWEHLLANMVVLRSLAFEVLNRVGLRRFLLVYILTGVGATLAHVAFAHYLLPKLIRIHRGNSWSKLLLEFLFPQMIFMNDDDNYFYDDHFNWDEQMSLGASGAITGLEMILTCLEPEAMVIYLDPVNFDYDVSLTAWMSMAMYLLIDIVSALTLTNRQVDTAGHVGGGITGFFYYILYLKLNLKSKNK